MQQPRQNYGLGSFVKKITKKVTKPITKVASKIVPKEIAGIMRIAAPFLPPGYREAAYLLGTAKQTGRISPVDLALTLAPSANQFFAKDKSMPFFQRKGFFAEQFPKADAFLFGSPAETVAMEGPVMGTKQVEAGRFFTEGSPFQQTQKFTKTFDVPSSTAGFTKDIAATEGIFGTGGKSFKFGKGKGLGSFRDDTKLGQLLLGGKDKQGKPTGKFSLSKILGLGIGGLTLIQSAKTPEEAGENLAASSTTAICDFSDVSFSSASFTANGALIYNSSATNAAVCAIAFGSDKTATNGTFTIQFPTADATNAIIRLA